MKLGPALKLRAILSRRLGHCAVCLHCVHCHGASSLTTTPGGPSPAPTARPNSTGNWWSLCFLIDIKSGTTITNLLYEFPCQFGVNAGSFDHVTNHQNKYIWWLCGVSVTDFRNCRTFHSRWCICTGSKLYTEATLFSRLFCWKKQRCVQLSINAYEC